VGLLISLEERYYFILFFNCYFSKGNKGLGSSFSNVSLLV
jgi:hypothetical protein